jgi:uncharacterized FlaG/YvyC family protein
MDVQFVPKAVLPSAPQASPHPVPATSADANTANKPLLANAAQSVRVAPEVSTHSTDRGQDRIGKQEEEHVTAQQALDSLRLSNLRTQLNYNRDTDTIVLQLVDSRTKEVIETIPPAELLRELKQVVGPHPQAATDNSGGAVVDRSI